MKALAAGDSTMLQKVELESRYAKLSALHGAWLDRVRNAERSLRAYPEQSERNVKLTAQFEAAYALWQSSEPKGFYVGKKKFAPDKRDECASALQVWIDQQSLYAKEREVNQIEFGIGPASCVLQHELRNEFRSNKTSDRFTLIVKLCDVTLSTPSGNSGSGTLTRTLNLIEGLPAQIQTGRERLARMDEQRLADLAVVESTFDRIDELRTVENEIDQLTRTLERAALADTADASVSEEIGK